MPTLVEKLTGRVRTAVILVGEVCTVAFFAVLAWAGVRVLTVLGGTTLVSLPGVPMSVAQSVIPIGAVLFILAQMLSLPDVLAGTPMIHDDPASEVGRVAPVGGQVGQGHDPASEP
jgi:TRAP-type C4-dicarboxylate transport system permease small subunit